MATLDATAGNRIMYEAKIHDSIIYIDVERKLERKPDIYADNRCLPFRSESFSTVFYDPPYYWMQGTSFYGIPDAETYHKVHPADNRKFPPYYGVDKIKSRTQCISAIFRAQREFRRVLTADGLLWFKWCDFAIPLRNIIALLDEWVLLLKFELADKNQQRGTRQTYWCCFGKQIESFQRRLLEVPTQ